ncbi:MAG: hypothetical protein LUC90_02590 [Lachnospiraceae bacterium]|nr:hypothetical protein [Lachnospiraceae bacterium]
MEYTYKEEVLRVYQHNYEKILNIFYPSKKSIGFTERNLTVNFSKAYEAIATAAGDECCSWFELPVNVNGRDHVDAVIINTTQKEILLIEAKRYMNLQNKVLEVIKDVERINTLDWIRELTDERSNDGERPVLQRIEDYKIFGVILADLWIENENRQVICELYQNHSGITDSKVFLEELQQFRKPVKEGLCLKDFCVDKPVDINTTRNVEKDYIRETYKLLSFSWVV